MKKDVEVLLKRAKGFIKDAIEDLKREDFDLAMFHVEQACQLIIKAKLLDLTGYFEKTHSLRRLLRDLASVVESDELEKFVEDNWTVLRNLEFAYIASRYLPEEFRREEVEEALKLYDKLRELLWSS
ncbi:HEPN domain-containing protein [Ferroglobus sp.]|uniref:HEPN domain-containing protein n=1 Tax=Ferroglobus sp. TaxID=2614230 RepID=UPI0025C606DB|nr:HEPN domain-containing protein [Ferroglobus sp.]